MNQNLESMCKLAITEFQDIPFEKLEAMLMPESVACKMPIEVTDMYDGTYKLSLASDVFLHNNEKLVNCKEDVIETIIRTLLPVFIIMAKKNYPKLDDEDILLKKYHINFHARLFDDKMCFTSHVKYDLKRKESKICILLDRPAKGQNIMEMSCGNIKDFKKPEEYAKNVALTIKKLRQVFMKHKVNEL